MHDTEEGRRTCCHLKQPLLGGLQIPVILQTEGLLNKILSLYVCSYCRQHQSVVYGTHSADYLPWRDEVGFIIVLCAGA